MDYVNIGGIGMGTSLGIAFLLLVVWSLFWKGLALWHSARREQGIWFLVLLIINTVGILEIIYLFGVLKIKSSDLIPKKAFSVPAPSDAPKA